MRELQPSRGVLLLPELMELKTHFTCAGFLLDLANASEAHEEPLLRKILRNAGTCFLSCDHWLQGRPYEGVLDGKHVVCI